MSKLIVLMIDGVSADYVASCSVRLPTLSRLASGGLVVKALHSEVCGTSLPGRTSILTGATADVSGIYGNRIWDGTTFRYASPDDVRVPTLAKQAKDAGKRVAVIGFGMVRPEDADIFMPPWWVGAFIQRGRDVQPVPSDHSWRRVADHHDALLNERLGNLGLPNSFPNGFGHNEGGRFIHALACDHHTTQTVGALAASDDGPDLILAEFLITDIVQHETGYKSDLSHWVTSYTDMLVGSILSRLEATGAHDYQIAVLSDHGHSPIQEALHPQVILPGPCYSSEGSMLHLASDNRAEVAQVKTALAPYGVVPYSSEHIPGDHTDFIHTFLAPDGVAFELELPADWPDADKPVGPPKAISSHGVRPGHSGDDRFFILSGPDISQQTIEEADAIQIAPTLAAALNIGNLSYLGQPIEWFD